MICSLKLRRMGVPDIKKMEKSPKLFVVKRGGKKEPVMFDKITSRIQKLCYGLDCDVIDPPAITIKVNNGIYPGVTTTELDDLAAETAIKMSDIHPDYAILAARIAVSNLHKETKKSFSEVAQILRNHEDKVTGRAIPIVSNQYWELAMKHSDRLDSAIIHNRDLDYSFFAFKELEKHILCKINGKTVERPQQMLMRVALMIHGEDIDKVIETYNFMSEKWYTHDFITLMKAGLPTGQIARSFSLTMQSDSIDGIYGSLRECGVVMGSGGEVGFNVHCIRATGSYISGTNGVSNGLVPMLQVYDEIASYIHQGGEQGQTGKMTVYIEPWHADVFGFVNLKKKGGLDEQRARFLNYGLLVPDLFMRRVEAGEEWSLMCPDACPGLYESYGEKFEELYTSYEKKGKFNQKVKARKLWEAIVDSQVENGNPTIIFKDACNRKSNHQNVGTIIGSNFTGEYMGYTSGKKSASSPGAALSLPKFVTPQKTFDYMKLKEVTKVVAKNLDSLIDCNYHKNAETKEFAEQLRPISINVLGLADVFIQLRVPFNSKEAEDINKKIFETIYYGALEASCELSESHGYYQFYEGSPVSKGILQYDMWNASPSNLHDWGLLKDKIIANGVRNSLLVGLTPTNTLAQIMDTSDGCEPIPSTIIQKTLGSGKYKEVIQSLRQDLTKLGLRTPDLERKIINQNGFLDNVDGIPQDIKDLYKTTWDHNKAVMKMAEDRAPYVDQSQTLNFHLATSAGTIGKLNTIIFDAWKKGLKTGIYQLRTMNKA